MASSSLQQFTPSEQLLRRGFTYLNRFMLLVWRLGLGSYGNPTQWGGAIMVITHTGRKTGRRRRTPVNYAIVDGELYCTAAFGQYAHWYRNMLANPDVEVWLPDGWWAGVAEDVSDSPQRLHLLRQVLIGSGFAACVAGINPHAMSDEEMDNVTSTYRLLRIRRTEPRTGPDGPGDLAWVWPVSTLLLLFALLSRKRR